MMQKILIVILLLAGLQSSAQNRRMELTKDTTSGTASIRKADLVKNTATGAGKTKGDLRKDLPELFITSDGRIITTSEDKKIIKQ